MKKALFLAAALGALLTFSCQKPEANTPGGGEDKTPSGKTLAAPTLQADKTAVTLDEASAAQEALKLSWTSGLSEGEVVVTSGTEGLTEGIKVEIELSETNGGGAAK